MFTQRGAALCAALLLPYALLTPCAFSADYSFDTPGDDRWQYPFNFTPGPRPFASTFGSFGMDGFNDRDGMFIVAWETASIIPPGLGAESYNVASLTVTLTNREAAIWEVDLSPDEWFTFDINQDDFLNGDGIPRGEPGDTDGESDDPDPGRALELFGVGAGPIFTLQSWNETSLYVGSDSLENIARDPFPFVFQEFSGEPLHVEDNIKGLHNEAMGVFEFTPVPWSVGVPIGYTPGNQGVPFDVIFSVDLSMSNFAVKRYFAEQLNEGRVFVAISAHTEAFQEAPQEGFPTYFTKEAVGLIPDAKAPLMEMSVIVGAPGDFDTDGDVDLSDFARFQECLDEAVPQVDAPCDIFDAEPDGDLDLLDFARFQRNFNPVPDSEE